MAVEAPDSRHGLGYLCRQSWLKAMGVLYTISYISPNSLQPGVFSRRSPRPAHQVSAHPHPTRTGTKPTKAKPSTKPGSDLSLFSGAGCDKAEGDFCHDDCSWKVPHWPTTMEKWKI